MKLNHLQDLLLNKFQSKYKPTRGLTNEAVDRIITQELKDLFSMGSKVDERDLVKKDKRIKELIKQEQNENRKFRQQSPEILKTPIISQRGVFVSNDNMKLDIEGDKDDKSIFNRKQSVKIPALATKGNDVYQNNFFTNQNTIFRNNRQVSVDNSKNKGAFDMMWNYQSPNTKLSATINAERTGTQMISARSHIMSDGPKSLEPAENERVATAYNNGTGILHMKARQSNYWNKITLYNHKLHQLEQKEMQQKKKRDQQNLRQMLNSQIESQKAAVSNEAEMDRQHVLANIEKYQKMSDEHKQKINDKKYKLQTINFERTEQSHVQKKAAQQDKNQLKEYARSLIEIAQNKEKEEQEQRRKIFQQSQAFARENLDRSIRIKNEQKKQVFDENRKYSPVNFKEIPKEASPDRPGEVTSPESQVEKRLGLETNISKLYLSGMSGAKSSSVTPQYNDFMNDIFASKKHKSYKLREIADKRVEYQSHNYKNHWQKFSAEPDQRVLDEQLRRADQNHEVQVERLRERKEKSLNVKEFQMLQMTEKQKYKDQIKKQTTKVFNDEIKKREKLDSFARRTQEVEAEKRLAVKNQLLQQIEQRKQQEIAENFMNPIDIKLNNKYIKVLDSPVQPGPLSKKPF